MTKSKLTTWNCADIQGCYCEQVIIFSTVQTSGPLWEQSTSNQCDTMSAHKWMISANWQNQDVYGRPEFVRPNQRSVIACACCTAQTSPDKYFNTGLYLCIKISIFVRYLKSFTPIHLCVYSNHISSLEKVSILYDIIYNDYIYSTFTNGLKT